MFYMKRLKGIVSLFICFTLCFSLTGCLGGKEKYHAISVDEFWYYLEEQGYSMEDDLGISFFDLMGLSEEDLTLELKEALENCTFDSYTTEDVIYVYTSFSNSQMSKAHFDTFVESMKDSVTSESSGTVKNCSFWQGVDSTNYMLAYCVDNVEILGLCEKEKKDEVRDNIRGMLSKDYSNVDVPVHKVKEVEEDLKVNDNQGLEVNENQDNYNESLEENYGIKLGEGVTLIDTNIDELYKDLEDNETSESIQENTTSEEVQGQYKFVMIEGTEEVPVYINDIGVEDLEYSESEYTLSVNATSKYNVMYSDSYIKIDDLDEIKETEKMLYTEGTLEEVIIGDRKGYIMHKDTDYVEFICVLQDIGLDSYIKINMTVYDKNIEIDDMVQTFTLNIK